MEASIAGGLLSFLAEIPDPRSRHGQRHPLTAILALVCCAIMSGAKGYAAIGQWGQDQDIAVMHRLGFGRTLPKAGGIRKVLIALDKVRFGDALPRWAESRRGEPIAAADRPIRRGTPVLQVEGAATRRDDPRYPAGRRPDGPHSGERGH